MSVAQSEPLLDFAGLCRLTGLGKDTVRKHLKSDDPALYWPHERFGRQYRFTEIQVAAILAKQQANGPGEPEAVLVTAAEFDRALARRRRDNSRAA